MNKIELNLKKVTLEDFKKIQLDILKSVAEFCTQNNIKYFLGFGTLLGAVRHKGFIPWDDDIDIIMPRPDYDKFVNSFNNNNPYYEVKAPELDPNYYSPFANVCDKRTILIEVDDMSGTKGVKIDVFPFDSVPDQYEDYVKFRNEFATLKKIMKLKRIPINSQKSRREKINLFLKKIRYFHSYAFYQKKLRKLATSIPYGKTTFVDNLVYTFNRDSRFEKSVFDSSVLLEFEGSLFNCPKDFDKVLSLQYGDYMKLPPEEQRVTHHGFWAYWK